MKNDLLKQYTSLREALIREKAQLEQRLREITAALSAERSVRPTAPAAASAARPATGRRRGKNPISLKDAVIQVTSQQPMNRHDILEAVQKLGYRFHSKAPLNSLGTILYGKKPKFYNVNGKFSPIGAAATARTTSLTPSPATAPKAKRRLSPQGRANIAAAARARWAKARAAKKA